MIFKSYNTFSIRKTKGKLLKTTQSFELRCCHHMTILCLFLCIPWHDKRPANCDIPSNKCLARLTNMSLNLDTDIMLEGPHGQEERNLIGSIGHIGSLLSSFRFPLKSFHAVTQTVKGASDHFFIIGSFLPITLTSSSTSKTEQHEMQY